MTSYDMEKFVCNMEVELTRFIYCSDVLQVCAVYLDSKAFSLHLTVV